MTINLVCVGNLKEKFSRDHQEEYLKRLSAFCKLNVIEIKEQTQFDNVALTIEKEGEEILKHIKGRAILCEIDAKQFSSVEFASYIQNIMQNDSTISFVVGGSYGVSNAVKEKCKEKISFSKMTFPHNLFRIMLLEQIYRAFTILEGKSYHK